MQRKRDTFKKGKRNPGVVITLLIALLLTACANTGGKKEAASTEEASTEETVKMDDLKAEGTAVVLSVEEEEKKIHFSSVETGEAYSFSYNGLTEFTDSYGEVKVPSQYKIGDIVDIVISAHSKILNSVRLKAGIFKIEDMEDYKIDLNRGVLSHGGNNYRISDSTVVVSGGVRSSFRKIKEGDSITAVGYGHDIYTIVRGGGTGYLKIIGQESFKGGWIEVGDIITGITDDMLIEIPEGSYKVRISYNGFGGEKQASVIRGQETVLNVSDLKGELLKTGKVIFSIEPEGIDPEVSIDGEIIDDKKPVEMEYGVHTLYVEAYDYAPVKRMISVGDPTAYISIRLEKSAVSKNSTAKTVTKADSNYLPDSFKIDKSKDATKKEDTDDTESKSSEASKEDETETVSSTVKLYVDGPADAEVYFDGSYKGIAPCSFTKTKGTHVITLRGDGYRTKHYTVTLNDSEDETYTFSALEKMDDDEEED